jgi:hypothetical protein
MGYFPNGTAGDYYEAEFCNKCIHQAQKDEEPGCPVMMAHMLYAYQLCNQKDDPGKVILDLLIPETKDGIGNERCAMFKHRTGVSERHLRDWAKYKEIMAEASI